MDTSRPRPTHQIWCDGRLVGHFTEDDSDFPWKYGTFEAAVAFEPRRPLFEALARAVTAPAGSDGRRQFVPAWQRICDLDLKAQDVRSGRTVGPIVLILEAGRARYTLVGPRTDRPSGGAAATPGVLGADVARPGLVRPRFRPRVALLLAAVVALGLFSRTPAGTLPVAAKEIGDALYATMFYLWAVLLAPRFRPIVAFGVALGITFALEFLKLCREPWLDAARAVRPIGFLLGRTFYWHDLACYLLGAAVGWVLDGWVLLARPRGGGSRTPP